MVMNDAHLPKNLEHYLNQQQSPLNPYNNNFNFFVYGNAPLIINKLLAIGFNNNNYNQLTIQGRVLSALIDFWAVILVFLLAKILEKEFSLSPRVKYLASFFYAVAVLPIQLSHFFATDTFINTFLLASCYFIFKFKNSDKLKYLILSALFFGLSLASKITALVLLPLIFAILVIYCFQKKIKLINYFVFCSIFVFFAYLSLRLANPYMFAQASLLSPKIEPKFIDNLKNLQSWEGEDIWFPPAIQWISKPTITFALKNLFFYGFGLVPSLLSFFSILWLIKKHAYQLIKESINVALSKLKKAKKNYLNKTPSTNIWQNLLILTALLWIVSFFIYQSTRFTKALRYFLIIYPYLAILAGIGLSIIKNKLLVLLLLVGTIIWPLSFLSIYLQPHSRITASEWIHQHLPNNAIIATELWDDPLPLAVADSTKHFSVIQLAVFNPDSEEKWQTITEQLAEADYYVLSSNRAWGSISQVPKKYPITSKFYNLLLQNKLKFKKIAEFTSYPSLNYLNIPLEFNDDLADETFTVYDHPKVIIFSLK